MIKQESKRALAKEWLVLAAFLMIGFTVVPAVIMAVFKGEVQMGLFYSELFSGSEKAITWLVALSPYILCQLIRSLAWAIRTVKSNGL
jgi:hypothetical protein